MSYTRPKMIKDISNNICKIKIFIFYCHPNFDHRLIHKSTHASMKQVKKANFY